jgi:hypothetical protein
MDRAAERPRSLAGRAVILVRITSCPSGGGRLLGLGRMGRDEVHQLR